MNREGGGSSKLHLGLFAVSLIGEVNTIRKQYLSGDKKLIYLSNTLSQVEMLWELTFAHLNETVEPLIYFFEGVKALLRLKEYIGLITKEKIGCYISKELYEVHKKEEEKQKSMVMLPRSKKMLPKPDNFPLSKRMMKFALKSVNSVDSLQDLDDIQGLSDHHRFNKHSISVLPGEDLKKNKGFLSRLMKFIIKKLKYFFKILKSRKLKVVEIMLILRPVIYMYLQLKYGLKSYRPFLVSLMIDIFGIIYCIQKSSNWKNETEKQELAGRWKGLLKYALKEPFFSTYTIKIVHTLLYRFINDSKIGYVLSILTYFKYYWYIV